MLAVTEHRQIQQQRQSLSAIALQRWHSSPAGEHVALLASACVHSQMLHYSLQHWTSCTLICAFRVSSATELNSKQQYACLVGYVYNLLPQQWVPSHFGICA